MPLALEVLTPPVSSKSSKKLSASFLLAAEHLQSLPGSPKPSASKQGNLAMSPSLKGSLGLSPSATGAFCFQAAQGTTEHFPFSQGAQQCLHSSPSYKGYMPQLQEDLGILSLEKRSRKHAQVLLETSPCTPGDKGPLRSLQRPLYLCVPDHETAGTSPSIQGASEPSFTLVETSQSIQEFIRDLSSALSTLKISPPGFVALKPLPVASETPGPLGVFQETLSYSPHVHRFGELSQYGSGVTNSMPYVQRQQRSSASSEGHTAPIPSEALKFQHLLKVFQALLYLATGY